MGRTVSGIRSLPSAAPCRLNDGNSRRKVQNVRGGSSPFSENAGHVPVTGLRLGSDNDGEGAMTPKNIALEPDLLEQVGKLAQEEGKTADELANELLGPLLEIRKQAEASDRRWQKLVEY